MAHDYAPFINGSYGAAILFLAGITITTFTRYQRARKRLKEVDPR